MYNTNVKKSSADRFIPKRKNTNIEVSHHKIMEPDNYKILFCENNSSVFFNFQKLRYNHKAYQKELASIVFRDQTRVLNFSSPKKVKSEKKKKLERSQWPVMARKKPLIQAPWMILDMPEIDPQLDHHIVDWGSKGYVATIFRSEVHLWHPEKKLERQVTNTGQRVLHCVKFNHSGIIFAMSLSGMYNVALWDCDLSKIVQECSCICRTCIVTSMDWTKDDLLVTGCTKGKIHIFTSAGGTKSYSSYNHEGETITIKLSANEKYIASSSMDCIIVVSTFPKLEPLFCMRSTYPVRGISWHPWKESILAVALCDYIQVCNVNTISPVARILHPEKHCFVDNLSFNPLSGELVVSYFIYKENGEQEINYLTVYENCENMVDQIRFHLNRAPYLLWDVTGTKLATASADENLCIWEFFGTIAEEKKYLRRGKKKVLTSDPLKTVFMIGPSIR